MILLSIIFLFVVIPALLGFLAAVAEAFAWQSDRGVAKQLSPKFGRNIYEGGPLRERAWSAFKRGYWSTFWWIIGLTAFGLLLWFIFKD